MTKTDAHRLDHLLSQIPEELAEQVRAALGPERQLRAESVRIARAKVESLLLGTMHNGVWRARGVTAHDVRLTLKAEGVALEKSHVQLNLVAEAAFQFPSLTLRGPRTMRSRPVPARVKTPELSRIGLSFLTRELDLAFNLTTVDMGDSELDVQPTADVKAGPSVLTDLVIQGAEASPLSVSGGLDLAEVVLDRLGLPDARLEEVRLRALDMDRPVRLTNVEVQNVKVAEARVGDVDSEALDLDFQVGLPRVKLKSFPDLPELIDRLVTRFWVEIQPTVIFHVGNLCLEGVRLSAEIGRVELAELEVPLSASSVVARSLEIGEITAEKVEI